jgi:two-component system sensor histidine kinase QseC
MIAMPILIVPAWLSVWFALKPFRKVAGEISAKGPQDLAPLAFKPSHRELRELGLSVDAMLERMRDSIERERRFIADAAHELRTPLAAMRINVEALQRRTQAPDDAALLEGLRHSGDRATRLVSQLLALMRSDAVPESVPRQVVRLDELAQERLAALGGIARERGVELELEAPVTVEVTGDRQGLITLIDNLVENAIKHSPARGVVRVAVAARPGGAEVTVDDQGPGIPGELRERVFERFFRAPDQSQPGSGLGLAIVKSVAHAHGASVKIEDAGPAVGLRVRITFAA